MRFIALDVETANSNPASICQVGAAVFESGVLVDTYCTLVDPRSEFGYWQTQVHGLTEADVRGAPTWRDVGSALHDLCGDDVVAAHSNFDRNATTRACEQHSIPPLRGRWLNTITVARRAWPATFLKGRPCGLKVVAAHLQISFKHHDALEDATAAGRILCRAIEDTGLSLHELLHGAQGPARTVKVRA